MAGLISPLEQNHKFATYSKVIKKHQTYLDFNYSADHILGQIRALILIQGLNVLLMEN